MQPLASGRWLTINGNGHIIFTVSVIPQDLNDRIKTGMIWNGENGYPESGGVFADV